MCVLCKVCAVSPIIFQSNSYNSYLILQMMHSHVNIHTCYTCYTCAPGIFVHGYSHVVNTSIHLQLILALACNFGSTKLNWNSILHSVGMLSLFIHFIGTCSILILGQLVVGNVEVYRRLYIIMNLPRICITKSLWLALTMRSKSIHSNIDCIYDLVA